ncbi:MAG: hypothetical protein HZC48_02500 [Nitrospirae bacterium]|nr:hypothetical protein [Nitrospirota bacterium]
MKKEYFLTMLKLYVIFSLFIFMALVPSGAMAFNLNVVDETGAPVSGFRWVLEEDTTHPVDPGVPVSDSLAVSIHKSYAPVVTNGKTNGSSATVNVPSTKRYALSVMANASGYTIGGTNVKVGQNQVTVTLHKHPIPSAQASIFVFHDNMPINNAPDIPFEEGLSNFSVYIYDQMGQMTVDAFGNALGTTYNPDGSVNTMGSGVILTDVNGEAVIKNLPPGKYGIRVVPDAAHANWIQNNTIEGTPGIDVWIKAGEPLLLREFGAALYHVFYGFVPPSNELGTLPNPGGNTGTITGQVIKAHQSRPPLFTIEAGEAASDCYVGLNTMGAGTQRGVYVAACNPDGSFTIDNVPPGTYQIVIWDRPLDIIFAFRTAIVPDTPGASVDLGQIPVNMWFGTLEGSVFYDTNENGFMDDGETGLSQQAINLRFRDGSIYQAAMTMGDGSYELTEVFPFFKYLITEVDFARFKATGATIVVDDGGVIPADAGWAMPSEDKRTPQLQAGINPNTGNNLSRTELSLDENGFYAPVLLEAMTLYADQNNRIDWGKVQYPEGQNGGISGIVYYGVTRAENDPRQGTGEPWEPGIPRVQVNLYQDQDGNGVIDNINGVAGIQKADVDNYPFGWLDGIAPKGTEDVDRNGNGVFDYGDALEITATDSWDDNLPTECLDSNGNIDVQTANGQPIINCAETMRTWNQVRPGVFDGGYAFAGENGLPAGTYIVEAVPPPGYEIVKEENKNVDFGDEYTPSLVVLKKPPPCVGDMHPVPQYLTLFPDQFVEVVGWTPGMTRPLCDLKQVVVADWINVAADFHIFTEVPKAARGVGLITNDLGLTLPNAQVIVEKFAPSWIPVSFKYFDGKEITRVYSDEFGGYNVLLPSTYTINPPIPTGVSPHMIDVCLNDPGPIPDPNDAGQFITDPYYKPSLSHVCYTLDFWPGKTTYLDTPLIPVAAFTGAVTTTLDCEYSDGTPEIYSVTGPGSRGPYISGTGQLITITSVGLKLVPNPAYNPQNPGFEPQLIYRDYGFGSVKGSVKVGNVTIPSANVIWAADGKTISATIPAGVTTGELIIIRGDNKNSTPVGITLNVGGPAPLEVGLSKPFKTIQSAIDAASAGALITVSPGVYNENIIMYKKVKLQGWGAASTIINAFFSQQKAQAWHTRVNALISSGIVSQVPGQDTAFLTEEGAGIIVLAKNEISPNNAKIDGLTIRGASPGGGIFVNGYARNLEISNNKIMNNQGASGGGIRIGTPSLTDPSCTGHCSSNNDNIKIHHNYISKNGQSGAAFAGQFSGGGGVSLYNGADNYQLTENFICGNFTTNEGGGVVHFGKSNPGSIENNKIIFNEASFGATASGGSAGGILISGEPAPAGAPGNLTPGTGSVLINANLIQGNLAGAGLGSGIYASFVNGQDVFASPGSSAPWYYLNIFNNIIVNNVAGFAGAVALQDVANASIINNTIMNNDSTATGIRAFGGGLQISAPQGAGIVSELHSPALSSIGGFTQTFSNPVLVNNVIWHNRSFYYDATLNGGQGGLLADPSGPYWDLAVTGSPKFFGPADPHMNPQYCILTSTAGYTGAGNFSVDPSVVSQYLNTIVSAASPGEGGNFISVYQTLLSLAGNYHIKSGSPAINTGNNGYLSLLPRLQKDFDAQVRPNGTTSDIGADELYAVAAGCAYSISPLNKSFGKAGGTGTVNVTTSASCIWTSRSNVSWIAITSGSSRIGSGTTTYRVNANTGSASRTGSITIAGKTFTVTQSAN